MTRPDRAELLKVAFTAGFQSAMDEPHADMAAVKAAFRAGFQRAMEGTDRYGDWQGGSVEDEYAEWAATQTTEEKLAGAVKTALERAEQAEADRDAAEKRHLQAWEDRDAVIGRMKTAEARVAMTEAELEAERKRHT